MKRSIWSRVGAFVRLGRPIFLVGGVVLYGLGAAIAAYLGHPVGRARFICGQVAVTATQVGYLFGGLLAIEVLFNYNGIGHLVFFAAQKKDYPLLQACVIVIGVVYLLATLTADILYSVLNPRIRYGAAE